MIIEYRAKDRGRTQIDWLDSWHSFSFGSFHDQTRMGVSDLRVINEDIVAPATGFATHGHKDMEILTYVLAGELAHKDSLGNGSTIRPGEIQRMSAGTGIRHSEMNPNAELSAHFLQIWIIPDQQGLAPSYEQKLLPNDIGVNGFSLIAGPEGGAAAVTVHQDAKVWVAKPNATETIAVSLAEGRTGYLHVAKGEVKAAGHVLKTGDAVSFSTGDIDQIEAQDDAEVLLFDLAI